MRQRAVRALVVVDAGEGVQQGLELREGGRLGGLGAEPVLEGLLESFDFPLGLGVVRLAVLLGDAQAAQLVLEPVAAALAAPDSRVVKTMPLSVRVEAGTPCFAQVARKVARVTSPVVTGCAVMLRA